MRQMASIGTRSGCVCGVASSSRHERHASAIRAFMAGTEQEAWLRARNARFVEQRSICGSDCGDTCGMEHAVVYDSSRGRDAGAPSGGNRAP